MSATIHLESSLPKTCLPNDPCKLLSALWGLRFALNHEHGPAHIVDVSEGTRYWLKLVGDCVEWPLDLLEEFIKASSEGEGEISRHSRLKKNGSPVCWELVITNFVDAYSKQTERLNEHFQKSINKLEQHWLAIRGQDSIWKNITLLGDLLHLSDLERMVLLYLVYIGYSRPLQFFFQDIEFISILKASETLACMFDCTAGQFMETIHQKQSLMSNGIVSKWPYGPNWENFIELTECVKTALNYPNKDIRELMRYFTDESIPGHLGVDDMPHLQNSLHMLTKVMSNALLNQECGVNILLYGAPGTGKTEFAKLLAHQVGAILYEVSYKDGEGEAASDRERYVSLLMAQKFLSDRDDTLLLFDEVEDVLDGSSSSGDFDMSGGNQNRSHFSKAWVNQQLEQNPVPVIWICNNHRYIDPAHLRRFLFHLEFRVPPRSVRQRIAERYPSLFE